MNGRDTAVFEEQRPILFRLAYRMLGSVTDAEDVVQDAFLRWHRAARETVGHPRAFLSKTVSRLCLDKLKEGRRRREVYFGLWLPEPILNDPALTEEPPDTIDGDVSFALMLALERLSPLERAAYLLHDIFDMEFSEIAAVLDRSEAACRQLTVRARNHVRKKKPRFDVSPERGAAIVDAFFAAAKSGDAAALRDVLAEDATLLSDGGGRVNAALKPVVGGEKVARYYENIARKIATAGRKYSVWSRRVLINGLPGELALAADGVLQTTALEISAGRVNAIYVTRNPEKLRHLAAFTVGET